MANGGALLTLAVLVGAATTSFPPAFAAPAPTTVTRPASAIPRDVLRVKLPGQAGAPSRRAETAPRLPAPAASPMANPCNGGWQRVGSPTASGDNRLFSVSGSSAKDVWAVGATTAAIQSGPLQTLAQHWDGSAWKTVSSRNPTTRADSLFTGVAAAGASDVWAVGAFGASISGTTETLATLAEHFDGAAWNTVATPNPGPGTNAFNGVAAPAPDNVWAVGTQADTQRLKTLIEHWNGTVWTVIPSPNAGAGNNVLNAVVALSPNDIWAVGYYRPTNDANTYEATLTLHWNGAFWAIVQSPNQVAALGLDDALLAVSGSGGNDVWAVGVFTRPSDGADQTLGLHWGGGRWTVVATPDPGNYDPQAGNLNPGGNQELLGVVSLSPSDAWAVGTWAYVLPDPSTTPIYHTMAVHWDGSVWGTNQYDTVGAQFAEFDAVASAGGIWGVGSLDWPVASGDQVQALQAISCQPPVITAVSPSLGGTTGGTTVTLQGSGLSMATGVVFGTTQAAHYSIDSDNQITASSPAEPAGTVDVRLKYFGGLSPSTALDQFTFVTPSAPDPPTDVAALAGDQSAMVFWSPPGSDGFSPITGYTVTEQPGGASMGLGADARSATFSGLSNGTSYTYTVTAVNALGASSSLPTSSVVPGLGAYQPVAPTRIIDTRTGVGGVQILPLGPGRTFTFQMAGRGGIPASGAAAVVLNVTATNTSAASYLTVYPAGLPRPNASNLNWVAGETVPNLVEVALGSGGEISFYNSGGSVDLVLDVEGYVLNPTSGPPSGSVLQPVVPTRLLDTRTSGRTLGAGQTLRLQVANTSDTAVVMNVTATNPTAASHLTVWADGDSQPISSNLNFVAGETVANRVQVKTGAGGFVDISNYAGSVDVVVDLNGRFAPSPSAGGLFIGVPPARALDTRDGTGVGLRTPLGPGAVLLLPIRGRAGIPSKASAVAINVTVTDTTSASYLTLYPTGNARPGASDINWVAGETRANFGVVQIGSDGNIAVYNLSGSTDVIVDVVGWYG